jgi:hypothetical protein
MIDNSELKQVTFLTTRTSTGSKVDVFHQSQPLTQSSDVTHAVRVVKNVTCLSSLIPDESLYTYPYDFRVRDFREAITPDDACDMACDTYCQNGAYCQNHSQYALLLTFHGVDYTYYQNGGQRVLIKNRGHNFD